jgi:hypothetical protein
MRSIRMKSILVNAPGAACLVASYACVAGCSHPSAGTTADAGVAQAASATPSATASAPSTPSVVDRALSFLSGAPFEGDITMTITPETRPPFTQVFEVKGDKLRMNPPPSPSGEHSYVVVDYAAKKMMSISDTKRTALFMNWDEVTGAAEAIQKKQAAVAPVDTGRKDVVAGYVCEIYQNGDPTGDKGEACIAKGIRFPRVPGASGSWLAASLGDDWFPMRVDSRNPVDKTKNHMEVTQVDKKSLPDSIFAIPPGYKSTELDDLVKAAGKGKGHSRK